MTATSFVDETVHPVVGYAIYRRVDESTLTERVLGDGVLPTNEQLVDSPLASYGNGPVRLLEDRTFVLGGNLVVGSEFPPGVWEGSGWVLPGESDTYAVRMLTRVDSTGTSEGWSTFFTATHTTTPSIWYASEPDSGYSVDNIAPGVPTGLVLGGSDLSWDTAPEPDFQFHSVYGSSVPGFDGTATLIGYTVEPAYNVSSDPFDYYHVTTSDRAGNDSEAATTDDGTSGVPGGEGSVPQIFALQAAQPNPFRGSTVIAYDLPETQSVRLSIFDTRGRRIRTLLDGTRSAGSYREVWDGRSDAGKPVAQGIYLARLTAGSFEASERVVVMQ